MREFDDDASREYLDSKCFIKTMEVTESDLDEKHNDLYRYAATRAGMTGLCAMDSDGLDSADWICAYDKDTHADLTDALRREDVYEDMF